MGLAATPSVSPHMIPVTPNACAADGVQVWMVRISDALGEQRRLAALLSPDELQRADRFRFPVDRTRFVTTRGSLRLVLGAYARQDPKSLVFDYVCVCGSPHCAMSRRKPALRSVVPGRDIRFNVSHSDDVALIAVSESTEVGVDIERIRPEVDWRALASEALGPADAAAVLALSGRRGLLAFYRCWAHKEAFLKALGRGLTTPRPQQPQDLAHAALHPQADHVWNYGERVFSARPLDGTPDDCVAALVVEAPPSENRVTVRPLPLPHLIADCRATSDAAAL